MKKFFIFFCLLFILFNCTQPGSNLSGTKSGSQQDRYDMNSPPGEGTDRWMPISGKLKQISVGNEDNIWGVNGSNAVYRWNVSKSTWDEVSGSLKCVSAGDDGTVWGVNAGNQIYRYLGSDSWTQMPGNLKQISVGNKNNIWGVNESNIIYRWNASASSWDEIEGSLKWVSAGSDGTVWGVNIYNNIYHYLGNNEWEEMPGNLKQISVGNADNIWGVNSSYSIYKWNAAAAAWDEIDGKLKCVSAGSDGTVWGVNINDDIYRRDKGTVTPPVDNDPPSYQLERRGGALSGKTVYLSAGHGKYWLDNSWHTERYKTIDSCDYIEDINSAQFINQDLIPLLEGLGANIITVRERDMNFKSKILYAPTIRIGYWNPVTPAKKYLGSYYQTASIKKDYDTSTAKWVIPTNESGWSDGNYALYVWYPMDSGQTQDAYYKIKYAGGRITTITLNQSIHGSAWRYIGTFPVKAGEAVEVTLGDRSGTAGKKISAGAIRLGGGTVTDLSGFTTDHGALGIPTLTGNPPVWWQANAWYNLQRSIDTDYQYLSEFLTYAGKVPGDASLRTSWAYWQRKNSRSEDAVYISWHSNSRGSNWKPGDPEPRGTHSFVLQERQRYMDDGKLQAKVHDEIITDLRAFYETYWNKWEYDNDPIFKKEAGPNDAAWGELSAVPVPAGNEVKFPCLLIEMAFHDNLYDTRALVDSYFKKITARAICNGIIKYFAEKDSNDAILRGLLPVPGDFKQDHPYNTTQCRVQRSITDPWDIYKEINLDEQIRIGTMHDESGYFAENRFIRQTVTGPNNYIRYPQVGEYITPDYRGTYQVLSATTRGRIIINHASFKVN